MSTTSPSAIWTPDFFWEAPATSRQHIDEFNGLSAAEIYEAGFLEGDYFTEVNEATRAQSPQLIRTFAEFIMAKVVTDGTLVVPPNPRTYATFQRASDRGQAENGQNLTAISERWLRTPVGEDFNDSEQGLLSFEQQQARDALAIERFGYVIEDLAKIVVRTDSPDIYEWPKKPGLVKDWPLVKLNVRTSGLHLGVTYADYQRGMSLSIPATPERIDAMRTFLEQFSMETSDT